MEVHAVDFNDPTLFQPSRYNSVASILNILVPTLMSIGALLFLIALLYATLMFMTAGGNPERLKKSKTMFVYAVVGIILLALSFFITKLIGFIFNVQVPI